MTSEQYNSIEERTRKVEEAVIRFGQIADIVLVQHNERLNKLETSVDHIETSIYESCDIKTKEISESKIAVLKIVAYVTSLGLAVTIYFNAHTSTLEADVARIKTIQENRNSQIASILNKLDEVSDKFETHNIENK